MDESHADEERQKLAGEENPQGENLPTHEFGVAPHEGPAHEDHTNKPKTLEERVTLLEEATAVEFIRREARLIPSLMNFWTHFRVFGGRTDPKSRAALSSLLWRVFSPATATAAAGGALMVLFTGLQIVLVAKQNAKLGPVNTNCNAQRHARHCPTWRSHPSNSHASSIAFHCSEAT